jgi:hypothetical protein
MKQRSIMLLAGVIALALGLAACGGDDTASKEVTEGDTLLSVTFDTPGDWEAGLYPADAEEPNSSLTVADGHYRIDHRAERSNSFTWGTGGDVYENTIVEVDTAQISENEDNLYGVACRLVPDNDAQDASAQSGYAFLISGDGYYGIADLSSRSLTFLLEWHQSDAIKQGRAQNTIRAVCVDDYLALYVNDTFLGEVTDATYRRAGQIGLIAGTSSEATVSVTFDNLTVHAGSLVTK